MFLPTTRLTPGPDKTEQVIVEPLTTVDMCDRDSGSVAAQVRVMKGGLTLDFCLHHFTVHGLALVASGWKITDDRRGEL